MGLTVAYQEGVSNRQKTSTTAMAAEVDNWEGMAAVGTADNWEMTSSVDIVHNRQVAAADT